MAAGAPYETPEHASIMCLVALEMRKVLRLLPSFKTAPIEVRKIYICACCRACLFFVLFFSFFLIYSLSFALACTLAQSLPVWLVLSTLVIGLWETQ